MLIYSIIAVIALLTYLNYRFSHSVLYPPFIFCALWLLVLVLYQSNIIDIDPLHANSMLMVGGGTFLFSLGGVVAYGIPKHLIHLRIRIGDSLNEVQGNHLLKYLLVVVFMLAPIASAHRLAAAAAQGSGATILAQARSATFNGQNEEDTTPPLIVYVPVWSICLATLFLIEKRNKLFWIMAATAFVLAVLTTGRGPVLELFSALITVHLLMTKKLKLGEALKFARVPIIIFFFLYVLLIFTNKDTSNLSGNVGQIIVYFVVSYIIGPLAALDYVLQHPGDYTGLPNHTFKFPLRIASALHIAPYTPPPLLDKFIAVPFPTNVYTGFKFFYTDFGLIGCLVIVCIIGFLHTLLYRKALTGSALGLFIFAFMMMPLVMFIFDDLYSATGEELNMLLVGCVYMIMRPIQLMPSRNNRHTDPGDTQILSSLS
jgi:oligosaccharide repeat unit polymerase